MVNDLTKRKIMLEGMLKKGKENILVVGNKHYHISEELAKRIRIKNFLLSIETVVFSIMYLLSIEKYRDIPFKGMDKYLTEGLSKTFVFLFFVVAGFILTSYFILPDGVEKHVEEIAN